MTHHVRSVLVALALVSLGLVYRNFSDHVSVHVAGNVAHKIEPPENGAYHGAYADFGATEDQVSSAKIRNFESLAGKPLYWALFSNHWLKGVIEFPIKSARICEREGVIPYISLLPWRTLTQYKADPFFKMQNFLDGKFDRDLRRWARSARDYGGPLLVAFGPEVNGRWFPWNGHWNGAGMTNGYGNPLLPDGPERFRDAYRHIIRLFRAERADNVTWVFHVDAQVGPEDWNKIPYYYPGDDFIDWIGVSVFGAQLPNDEWTRFADVLNDFWPQIEMTSKVKPVLIAEYAVIEDANYPLRKARWISEALNTIAELKFPRVKGMTYWHSPGWLSGERASFKINSSQASLTAYREAISRPFWISRNRMSAIGNSFGSHPPKEASRSD